MKPKETFQPNPDQLELAPDITGWEINGVGETEHRQPTRIYWHDPSTIAHGKMQLWFYSQNNSQRAAEARKKAYEIDALPLPDIAEEKIEMSAEDWTTNIKKVATDASAELVGIAKMRPQWLFEGSDLSYQWIIIVAMKMDFDNLSLAPSITTSVETMAHYSRGALTAKKIAGWIRDRGWDAHPHCGPASGPVLLIPAAIEAGIGQLGKHGSMISREYGSNFRLAGIMTDVPLIADDQQEFGSDVFCQSCQVCINACPPEAIIDDKQTVRGDTKWYTDFDKCIYYFNENMSCAICLAVCPWSKPGAAPKLAEKMLRRRQKTGN